MAPKVSLCILWEGIGSGGLNRGARQRVVVRRVVGLWLSCRVNELKQLVGFLCGDGHRSVFFTNADKGIPSFFLVRIE
jgi:hypothetical protein